jgi:hypothetical protein
MSTFKKYKKNLSVVELHGKLYVRSYQTLVAKIDYEYNELVQLGYWSVTTQKHINYAAAQLNLKLIK